MAGYSDALETQLFVHDIMSQDRKSPLRLGGEYTNEDDIILDGLLIASEYGDTFYLGEPALTLIEESMEDGAPTTLVPDMIPSRIGFVWLERPLRNDHEDLVQGFGWTHVSEMGDPTPALFGVTFAIVNEQGRRGVQTGHFGSWIMNDRPNLDLWEENWPLKFQAALFLFMEQRILMSYHERPDRASRRRMGESRPEAIIRVIKLRRLAHIEKGSKSNVEVEWSCQWITRGHWRQQWYPSLGRHQPKWIAAYVKGPEDKPLKAPRNNIFAVVR